jgi:adenosylmethionine---8-amino-7-oxononanoate aminotransferase
VLEQAARGAGAIARAFERIAGIAGVARVRSIGMIGADDLVDPDPGYLSDVGWRVYEEARRRGAYLRPLGSTVYVSPPLTISESELDQLLGILEASVRAVTST